MAERFAKLTEATMTEAQRRVASHIAGTRGGDGARGPFNFWLRAPELADRMQRVGAYVRYEAGLPQRLIELVICFGAVEWGAAYEWHAHAPLAVKAGLDPKILAALAARRMPEQAPEEEAAVLAFCAELHRERRVSDASFARIRDLFGEAGLAELTIAAGYYVAVAMTLNVAEVELPAGAVPFGLPG
jgi:4-carboxymuconolactone decarboxylase